MVSTDDPSLIFTERGGDLTEMATLHHAAVWVVCPSDARAVDPVSDQEIPVLEEHEVKAWEGWAIRLLDLSSALSLHLERPGERRPSIGSVRAVDPRQRVRFIESGSPSRGYAPSPAGRSSRSPCLSSSRRPSRARWRPGS